MNAVLDKLGRLVSARRWWFIGGWVVVLVALALLRGAWGGTYVNNYSVPGSSSQQGLDKLQKDFPAAGGYSGQIVFAAPHGSTVQAHAAVVATTMTDVGKLPHVISAVDPLKTPGTPALSRNGRIAYGAVSWDVVPGSLDSSYLDSLNAAVQPARSAGLTVDYGGGAGQIAQGPNDLLSEGIGLACALLLLFLMFGSVLAALIPLGAAVFSVGSGLALVALLAALTQLPTTAPTVATLLGLGVAVDYGLFLVSRHRDQLAHGMRVHDSVGRTEATSGAAIVVAGSTVVVAILGLYVSGVPFIGALGAASAIVVAVTVLSALTLVPALMSVAGARLRPREPRSSFPATAGSPGSQGAHDRGSGDARHETGAFARWGRRVSSTPWPWAAASVATLLVLAVPLLSLQLGQLDAGDNPTSQSSRRAYDLISRGFGPGANGPITVVVDLPAGGSAQSTQALLTSAQEKLSGTADVASVAPPSVSPDGTVGVLNVVPASDPQAAATTDLVDRLRDSVLPSLGTPTYLVGTTAGYVDFTNRTADRMLWLILVVIVLALLLLTLAFRSVVIAVKGAVLNLLSVGAAYGVIVAVFQWGWGSRAVGIDQTLPIPAYVPMLMFAIVFGLSMDYEVFLLSRIHEAWTRTGDAHRSVAIGIGSTARVITTAAGIMIAVFLSFVRSTDPSIKMLGIGMAVAVLIDASVVRMVLMPSLMALLGARAWWLPAWLDRVLPNLRLEGEEPVAAEVPAPRPQATVAATAALPAQRSRPPEEPADGRPSPAPAARRRLRRGRRSKQ